MGRQKLSFDLLPTLKEELAESINPDVQDHWEKKISAGIVPTEVKKQVQVNPALHLEEMERLASFEVRVVQGLYDSQWKPGGRNTPGQLHYFGIGTGVALSRVRKIANENGDEVVAYDVCDAGYRAGLEAFRGPPSVGNRVLLADIEVACQRRYIKPSKASKLVACRVLDVLDTQERGKMARTARGIGKLTSFLDVLIMHPCSLDNPNAVWGDTTPHTLAEVLGHVQRGRGVAHPLDATELGKQTFHGHVYTMVLIQGR